MNNLNSNAGSCHAIIAKQQQQQQKLSHHKLVFLTKCPVMRILHQFNFPTYKRSKLNIQQLYNKNKINMTIKIHTIYTYKIELINLKRCSNGNFH